MGATSKLPGRYAAEGRTGRREACCLWTVWLANPGPQERPDLLGGLGCLGGAEHDRGDVGQALADLEGDVDPGLGCCCGQALGITQQQVGRAGWMSSGGSPAREANSGEARGVFGSAPAR